jgi:hypothetical protein
MVLRNQAWWYMPVILALWGLKQEDCKFEVSLDCTVRPCLRKTTRHWWLTPVILATWKAEIWKITVGSQPKQYLRSHLPKEKKKGRAKWTGVMVQAVRLLCKYEALSTNPNPTREKKKKKKKRP